jgi:signal transduction histidine kinase
MLHEDGQPHARERAASEAVEVALHRYLAHAPLPFAITRGPLHALAYANDAFCRVPGLSGDYGIGASIVEAFPEPGRADFAKLLDRAYAESTELLDVHVDLSGSGRATHVCSVWPVVANDQTTEGLGVEFREANESDNALDMQRQIAEQSLLGALRERGLADDAEAARRRAAFLAEAGRLLAESVDRAGTLVALTKLALPTLGSWCVVDLLGVNGALQRLGIFHPDPLKQEMAARLETTWTPQKTDGFGVAAMLYDVRTISVTTEIESVLGAGEHGDENRRLLQEIGAGALLSVPLVARGKLLGAITFISPGRRQVYSEEDIQLAEDLAHRGSLALENAQLYDTAVVLKQSAESADRAKTAFLGAMSHELRTPLNAIGGYVDIIEMGLRGPVTDLQRTDLARIKTNQQHLLVLITEILNYARLGGGHVTYNVVEFNVIEQLDRAVQLVEPLIARGGLSYESVHKGPTIVARADPEKVLQILVNLLSNAIKFTPEGGRISIETEASGGFVFIGVRDTGVGIPADRIENVFEPFVQLKDSLSGREGGVGLGLAISRDLARAMSGELSVASVEGRGSCFTLALQGYPI